MKMERDSSDLPVDGQCSGHPPSWMPLHSRDPQKMKGKALGHDYGLSGLRITPRLGASTVPCRPASPLEEARTACKEKGPEPSDQTPEILGMLADAIVCQSCNR